MGVDMGDVDGDGLQDFFVTNFQWESNTLYRNAGHGFFIDSTVPSGVHKASMAYLGFGTGFIDLRQRWRSRYFCCERTCLRQRREG